MVTIFCFVAGLYRKVLRQHPTESLMLILLPEIFTNILLAVVMFSSLKVAYDALLIATAFLIMIGSVAMIQNFHFQQNDGDAHVYQALGDHEDNSESSSGEWMC